MIELVLLAGALMLLCFFFGLILHFAIGLYQRLSNAQQVAALGLLFIFAAPLVLLSYGRWASLYTYAHQSGHPMLLLLVVFAVLALALVTASLGAAAGRVIKRHLAENQKTTE